MKIIVAFIFIFSLLKNGIAQKGNNFLNDSIIHTIDITTPYSNWFEVLSTDFQNSFNDPDLYPEIYRLCSVVIDGNAVDSCGFRHKGNFSNIVTSYGVKKPMKISFNEFLDQKYDGLKKINLHNFTNDPSLLHDFICYELFRDNGIPAPRTAFAKVSVNNVYIGVYLMVENVDKTFLGDTYGKANNEGNLYKTDRGAQVFLNYLGNDKQAYKDKGLKLTTNETADDYSGIIDFIYFLNNYTQSDFKDSLEKRFDVYGYLKILAIEKCVRSWDNYWGGGNNFFMYEHPDRQYRWIPWDMNESFQDVKLTSGSSIFDGYLIPTRQMDERPLIKRIFEIPEYKEAYLNFACELAHTTFTVNALGERIVFWHNLIDRDYFYDPNKNNSYLDFKNSLTDWNADEINITKAGFALRIRYPGIFPLMVQQQQWVEKQMKGWDKSCEFNKTTYSLTPYPNPAQEQIYIATDSAEFQYAAIKVFSVLGQQVINTDYILTANTTYQLNIANLAPGIYIITKQDANGNYGIGKFIKQ